MNNFFRIVVPVYNSEKWIYNCLCSIKNQLYKNFKIYIVNDCSTDKTENEIQRFLNESSNYNIEVIINKMNEGSALISILKAWELFNKENIDDIIIPVDGDDYIENNNEIFNKLNEVYSDPNIWLTYGNMRSSDNSWSDLLKEVDINNYRYESRKEFHWYLSHLRTFRLGLFNKLDKSLLLNNGKYYDVSNDVAFMLPLAEMAGNEHIKFVKDIFYVYNTSNPLSDCKLKKDIQIQTGLDILKRPKVDELENYDNDIIEL